MKIAVAQLGARRHYAIPRILYQAGKLEHLYTDICAAKGWPWLLRTIPPSLRSSGIKRILGRVPKDIPPERIIAFNGLGFEYARRLKGESTRTEITAVYLWALDRFCDLILRHGLGMADTVYGFNAGCINLFREAKLRGHKLVMEQISAPRQVEQRLLDAEFAVAGEWGQSEQDNLMGEVVRREKEAWYLADLVLCGSEFVRQAVVAEGGPAEKCVVVPYGVELSAYNSELRIPRRPDDPLKVIFVGGIRNMKGARYLLEAMRLLEEMPVHCRMVGSCQVPPDVLKQHTPPNVTMVGHIPRADIAREYANADVFCLPSLCEGSATVIYEALAAGLPIITTHNTGSIVRDMIEGFVVPIQNSRAIANRIKCLIVDRALLQAMSIAARERSAVGSIEAYSQRLLAALNSLE